MGYPEIHVALDEVLARLDDELTPKTFDDTPPGPLFHYTDAAGFRGIFTSKNIWATDFRYLNDTVEMRIGERTFREVAVELAESAVTEQSRFILRRFIEYHDRESLSKVLPPCVASFSLDGDLLSQWRAYAAGGAGYSIGFSAFPLPTGPAEKAQVGLGLIRCEYDEARFRLVVREKLLTLGARYEATMKEFARDRDSDGQIGGLFIALALRHAGALVPRLKHRAFREEKEWRLMVLPRADRLQSVMEYRSSTMGLVPYIPIQLASETERLPVTRVYVGPTQEHERGVLAARGFLAGLGYDPDIVVSSDIPFRG